MKSPDKELSPRLAAKYERLRTILKDMGRVLVAFSGGVDSTLLLKTARDVLGRDASAVLASAVIHPAWETREARSIARSIGTPLTLVRAEILDDPDFSANPPDRCYHCKKKLFARFLEIARAKRIPYLVEGSNAGDLDDFRPGKRALAELGVRSPLLEAGLNKREIRQISKWLGLETAGKPALACLASRIPYGTRIDRESLARVEAAERVLRRLGLAQFRVRHHGPVARVEAEPERFSALMKADVRARICREFRKVGYRYVALDLEGYRTGSLNEVLPGRSRARKTKT